MRMALDKCVNRCNVKAIMKLNQKEVADKIGIWDTTFSRILSGQRNLPYPLALQLADIVSSLPEIWIKGGGTSAQRREAWWEYLLTPERKEADDES